MGNDGNTGATLRQRASMLFLCAAANAASYWGARALSSGWSRYDMTTPFDRAVPFLPWTSSIYIGCFAFWVATYAAMSGRDAESACRFFAADLIAKAVCFALFLAIPTMNVRPAVTGGSLWDEAVRWVYANDSADNLFPSTHCLVSWLCFIAVRGRHDVSLFVKSLSGVFASSVCISTQTMKQHVVADLAASLLIAEGCWALARLGCVRGAYGKVLRIAGKKQ